MARRGHSIRRETIAKLAVTPLSARRKRTREKLLQAGSILFIKKGILGTSVGDICEEAGFSRGAFYSNFADMDHFIHHLAADQWSRILTTTMEAFTQADVPSSDGSSDDKTLTNTKLLASKILSALPISRDFYLLLAEFSTYLVRTPGKDNPLHEGAEEFKTQLADVIETKLADIGRRSLISASDTVNMILALADRSMNLALTLHDEDLSAYLVRTLPTVLVRLTVAI
ncbi:TetR/AcrR family transcriptional regulator [Arcanobacterium pinnipediorum]|uniref:TetR/AcrR family transcriptional regulator n=1 Tax=Arcanobacterium pinnipediorum TaxID=1503041 RepID=A0ABY5AGW2_9ACTO|nr:TetR/AcrR family transcriptional regulator [Arcanobacterium pinnipediorum]USR79429.1 TetR/AcrR family transcriptional regulator [Arcanobacterium pinnipediorum]